MKTIVEKMILNSYVNPDRRAVIFEDSSITYSELRDKVIQLSNYLKNIGITSNDKVIVQGSYNTWFVVSAMAIHLCSAVFVPVDMKPLEESIRNLYNSIDAKLFIGDFHIEGISHLLFDDISELLQPVEASCEIVFPSLEQTADMMFTTGTTGVPKGVELTHENLSATADIRVHECQIKENNIGITLVPMNHVAPMRELYLNLYNGSSFIFLNGIAKMKKMFEFMDKYRVTSIYTPPASISIMSQLTKNKLKDYSDKIDYVYTASAPMQVAQQDYMREMLPNTRLYFSYGSSENGSVCLHRYDRDLKDITCCGRPCIGVDVKIFDDDFVEMPVGQLGRIAIKSSMNMKGYYKRPELNEAVFQNGYFLSNDIGYFDSEGFLYVTGRKDDIINIGGLKVYPSEIETAALTIEGIVDCVCYSVEDRITGQAAKLLILLKDGEVSDVKQIHNSLAEKMDAYKIPKYIEFVDTIERTTNGKVNRKYYVELERKGR